MFKHIVKILAFFICFSINGQSDYIKNNASLWLKNDSISNCLHYNYNCTLNQLESSYKLYSNNFSFFIAYKAENDVEKDIVSLKYGRKEIKITNKYVLKQNDTITTLNTSKKAKIVSYLHNDATFSKKGKLFIDLLNTQTQNEDILEIIFIPKVVSLHLKEKIETYLSLKYGFSLVENQYYRSVKNDTLWNPVLLSDYSMDVTGMGSDNENFFNSSKSTNFNLKGLELISDNNYSNNNYVLWGHNGNPKLIAKNNELTDNNYKIWHFKKHLDSIDSRLFKMKIKRVLLDSSIDTLHIDEKIYLYVSHYNLPSVSIDLDNGQYYEGIFNSENDLVFENLNLLDNSRFIFIKAPNLNVFMKNTIDCGEKTKLTLDFVEGKYPLNIKVSNEQFVRNYFVENSKKIIDDLPEGKYNIQILDFFKNEKNIEVEIKKENKFQVKLKEQWDLNENNFVIVFPEILKSEKTIQFTWKKEEQIIGSENTIKLESEGDYSLLVSNGVCEENYEFKVNSNKTQFISLFPNPSKINEEVTIQLLDKINELVEVKINDINGKLIKLLTFEKLNANFIKLNFDNPGVYLVNLKTKDYLKVFKVIVN